MAFSSRERKRRQRGARVDGAGTRQKPGSSQLGDILKHHVYIVVEAPQRPDDLLVSLHHLSAHSTRQRRDSLLSLALTRSLRPAPAHRVPTARRARTTLGTRRDGSDARAARIGSSFCGSARSPRN